MENKENDLIVQVPIRELIALTPEQEQLCMEMETLYVRMQESGIAFAQDDDGDVVTYNAMGIEDCEDADVCGEGQEGYEYADQNGMRKLFPVWAFDTLYVKRK